MANLISLESVRAQWAPTTLLNPRLFLLVFARRLFHVRVRDTAACVRSVDDRTCV